MLKNLVGVLLEVLVFDAFNVLIVAKVVDLYGLIVRWYC